jgi:PIN domain nuclease of toxin-antitoxin system
MATKHRLGKLPGVKRLLDDFAGILATAGMSGLPMTIEHALAAGSMRAAHADPFDRILAAQSQIEQLLLVTSDAELSRLVPTTVW